MRSRRGRRKRGTAAPSLDRVARGREIPRAVRRRSRPRRAEREGRRPVSPVGETADRALLFRLAETAAAAGRLRCLETEKSLRRLRRARAEGGETDAVAMGRRGDGSRFLRVARGWGRTREPCAAATVGDRAPSRPFPVGRGSSSASPAGDRRPPGGGARRVTVEGLGIDAGADGNLASSSAGASPSRAGRRAGSTGRRRPPDRGAGPGLPVPRARRGDRRFLAAISAVGGRLAVALSPPGSASSPTTASRGRHGGSAGRLAAPGIVRPAEARGGAVFVEGPSAGRSARPPPGRAGVSASPSLGRGRLADAEAGRHSRGDERAR